MNKAKATKWEAFKNQTAELSRMINYTGRNGMAEALKDYQEQYEAAHRAMRTFARRNGLMNEYEAWIA